MFFKNESYFGGCWYMVIFEDQKIGLAFVDHIPCELFCGIQIFGAGMTPVYE